MTLDFFQSVETASPALHIAALFFGTFFSEDAACVAAGALAADGRLSFAAAVGACFAGIFAGDVGIFMLGRVFGRRFAATSLGRRMLDEERLDAASRWLAERGPEVVFLSRFVFGLRVPTYFAAGLLRTSFSRFAVYLAAAALLWTPILVGAAAFSLGRLSGWFFVAAALLIAATISTARTLASYERRRLFVGKVGRMVDWEFWPLWLFYAPVVGYVILLGIRFRSATLFTAANPAIPHSGFAGESKASIYRGLAESSGANERMLRYFVVAPSSSFDADGDGPRLEALRAFRAESGCGFPFIVKPDAGERGAGVRRVGDEAEYLDALRGARGASIVQEFYDGVEASVFYVRHPDQERGRIFSITEKRFPELVGDGRRTLRELIFEDRRAVRLAAKYFEQNKGRLTAVPTVGETVRIVDIGTHSRGAVFVEGEHLRSGELEAAIYRVCRGYEGFYFGRFDLRAPDFDALRSGSDFRIIELNGVTSESTNIYDPAYSLRDAYRILFRQWRLAFEIGAANVTRGTAVATPAAELLRVAWRHLSGRS